MALRGVCRDPCRRADQHDQQKRQCDAGEVCADAVRIAVEQNACRHRHERAKEELRAVEHVDHIKAVDRDVQDGERQNVLRPVDPEQQAGQRVQQRNGKDVRRGRLDPAGLHEQHGRKRCGGQNAEYDGDDGGGACDPVSADDGAIVVGDQPEHENREHKQEQRDHDLQNGGIIVLLLCAARLVGIYVFGHLIHPFQLL